MSTYAEYNNRKVRRFDMPWGLLIFIAGLVTYFVTEYDQLGVILMAIGGFLFLIGIIFFILVFAGAMKMSKSTRRSFNNW